MIILSAHISGIAKSTVFLSGVVTSLNNKEFKRMNFATSASTLQIVLFLLHNLF